MCSLVVSAAVEVLRSLPLGPDHPTALRRSWAVNPCEDEGYGSSSSSTLAAPTARLAVRVGGSAACSTALSSACWWLCCLLLAVMAWRRARCARLLSPLRSKMRALSLTGKAITTAWRRSWAVNPCEDEGYGSSSSSTLAAPTPHLAVRVGGSAACSWRRWHGGEHDVLACCLRFGRRFVLSPSRPRPSHCLAAVVGGESVRGRGLW